MGATITKKRVHYFDIAKGILVLLLLFYHFSSATRRAGLHNPFFIHINSWESIYAAFFMQCFFIISGYCSNFDNEPVLFLKKIVKQLIIPWVVFELLQATFWALYYSDFTLNRYVSFLFTEPCTTLWFLNALAFSKVFVYVLKRYCRYCNNNTMLIVTFIILIIAIIVNQLNIGPNYLTIRQSFGSCFFVALGYYLKRNQRVYGLLMKYSPYIYVSLFLFLLFCRIRVPIFTANMQVNIKELPFFFILSTTGSISFLRFCKYLNQNKIFEFFGKNSLTIYCVHFCPLYAFIVYYHTLLEPFSFLEFILFLILVYFSELFTLILLVHLFRTRYLCWIIGK